MIASSAKIIPVQLKPGAILSGNVYYNHFIKLYNSINYLRPAHLDSGITT